MSDGSTGRIVGTIVGAVAGYFTGGASYVALGATLGGAAGSLLDPKQKTETNRLDDIKVSISKYGDGIPETWGNNVPPATWIWSTYVIQIPQKQSGGKGGGTENTNYLQFIYGTLCFGKSPPPGVPVTLRKLWIDGKLNYDGSTGLSAGQALANDENPFQQIIIRDGNEDQLPWALTETWEGVGNVPAHRGKITGEIFGLQVPGGRFPQIQVEICIGATVGVEKVPFATFPRGTAAYVQSDGVWHFNVVDNGAGVAKTLETFYGTSPASVPLIRNTTLMIDTIEGGASPVNGAPFPMVARGLATFSGDTRNRVEVINLQDGTSTIVVDRTFAGLGSSLGISAPICAAFDSVNEKYAFIGGAYGAGPVDFRTQVLIDGSVVSPPLAIGARIAYYNGVVYAVYYNGSRYLLSLIDAGTGAITQTLLGPGPFGVLGSEGALIQVNASGVYLWLQTGAAGETGHIYNVDVVAGTWTVLCSDAQPLEGLKTVNTPSTFYCSPTTAIVGPSASPTLSYDLIRFSSIQPALPSVGDIIASQSLRSGLSSGQFDVADIDDTVWGLTFKSPASARSNIAPLMTYAAIGVVEEDGLLRYFHRADKASIATVAWDELGCAEDGAEPGDPFPLLRANAQEFPRSITVTYNDPNFDYQQSTVKAMRYAVDSINDEQQVLDVAMDGSRAASIAHRLLYERWLAQNTRSFKVLRKYAYWSAGDVVTFLKKDGTSYGAFMLSKLTDTGAVIEGECFPADGDLAIQTVPGPGAFKAQQIEPLAPATRVFPVDTSILRDSDDNAGLYVAMSSYSPTYPGSELFVDDENPPVDSVGAVTQQAPQGSAEGVLGDFSLNVVDESNLLTVSMGQFTLNSVTRSVLLSGAIENVAAIGAAGRWEIVKFQRTASLGDGRYILSGLLRGLRGTEWARGLHQSGDQVILLGVGGVLRPNLDTASIGQAKFYRGVTTGRSFNSAPSITYTNTAEGLMPFSPAYSRVTAAGTDALITVQRRTRLSSIPFSGALPLGEATEQYEMDIFSSGSFTTLLRTLTSTTGTFTYTAAMKVADGYTSGPIYRRIYQISDRVGRGHALEAS